MNHTDKILVLGANGMVGRSLVSLLKSSGYENISTPRSINLNLLESNYVADYFEWTKPDFVFFLSAKVGGIQANIKNPATFGYDNGLMAMNVLEAAKNSKVKKLLYMGSSCIYPKECPQPMKEEYLLTGTLEPTNQMYSLAKIFGLKMCESYRQQYGCNFISCMPSNIYGPNDHFDENSHVMSALLDRFHQAKVDGKDEVICFGTGVACREFTYVDDVSQACVFLMNNYNDPGHINVGAGSDISIRDLATLIASIVGYTGKIGFDSSKPDGMLRKIVDTTKINKLGWNATISLEDGIKKTYQWYLENIA